MSDTNAGDAKSSAGEKPVDTSVRGRLSTWLKTFIGTAAGVLSGAVMMYLSPLLDKVVKPSKPVANFAVEHEGLTVSFHNRSTGGSQGWWDFGDGSALEPLVPKQDLVAHTYPAPGSYVAKLTLDNLLGDESERTVTVQLESPASDPPKILSLDALPLSPGSYAPATFRVVGKAENAKLCIWDYGDDRKLDISSDSPNDQDHFVVFNKPGGYTVKVAMVNGDRAVEKSTIVYVDEPPPGAVTAILSVADEGTRLEKVENSVPITAAFPPQSTDSVFKFERQIPAKNGYEITAARFEPISGDQGARGLSLKVSQDKHSALLTGELVKKTGLFQKNGLPANLLVRAALTQERRLPDSRPPILVTATLASPGSALLVLPPLPASWIEPQRQLRLELREGDRVAWQESQLPRAAVITLQNKRWILSATPLGSQVRVALAEETTGQKQAAN